WLGGLFLSAIVLADKPGSAKLPRTIAMVASQNIHQRYIWPGINDYNAAKSERGADEIQNQIMVNRGIAHNGPGVIHWSVGSLLNNDTLLNRLQTSVYRHPALIPALTWDAQDPV